MYKTYLKKIALAIAAIAIIAFLVFTTFWDDEITLVTGHGLKYLTQGDKDAFWLLLGSLVTMFFLIGLREFLNAESITFVEWLSYVWFFLVGLGFYSVVAYIYREPLTLWLGQLFIQLSSLIGD